ncbi:hypothetical protein HG536_0C05150 [Torulaspora globosa]|uniref:Mitochondrial group I intron splicing factor CCM1 n=1 Tax=Torulaspora globosa TaxID=48254 RepID=A0A7G3ZFR0_9SACH|nr:uncharacterized protein HG536_0C05150 [Torulaspora globosa]QLL32346.1 hypothetical protein HG536_0C05150 [Torulaspora globosa]
MLRNQWRPVSRNLHIFRALGGSQVKEKLRSFEHSSIVLHKTSKEMERLNKKKLMKLKKLRKTAYSKQQAIDILSKKHGFADKDSREIELGPTSLSDLKFMSTTRDRRMLYTILGVNGEQLRDSKLVKEDAEKFLKRGQVEKAVFLARLAKKKGAAAMNSIMEYYLHDLQYPQSAVKMYNWRKKWGIPANEYTNTILFKGLARQSQHISRATGEFITKVVNRSIEREELSQIEFNAALGALANCTDVTLAFELFDRKLKGVRRDAISYLWMLRASSRIKTDQLFNTILGGLMEGMSAKCVDSQLLFEFCKTLASRSGSKETRCLALAALNSYFSFDLGKGLTPEVPQGLAILPLSHWSLEEKYPVNKHAVGLFLRTCLQAGKFELGIDAFKRLKEKKRHLIDVDMFHLYMELLMKNDPKNCGEQCLKVFEEMESFEGIPFSKHTLVLVYRSFEVQSSKKAVYDDDRQVERLLRSCRAFCLEQEGVFSKEAKSRIIPIESWQFFVRIVKNLNAHGKVTTYSLKMILDDFMKAICYGIFDVKHLTKTDVARSVELEIVRLLAVFTQRLDIPDIEELDTIKEGPEREIFLLRRLGIRFKNALLRHVSILQSKEQENEDVSELEWSLKQLAQKFMANQTLESHGRES